MDILAERIRAARITRGLSQEDLAKLVGYTSRASINKIEKGLVDLPRTKVMAIAKALHVSPAWLLGLSETEEDTGAMMQDLFDKHQVLFKALDTATPEELDQVAKYLEFLKSQR